MECLTTSFLNNDYYIVNTSEDMCLFYLMTILSYEEETQYYSNVLSQIFSLSRTAEKKNLFVHKNSSFGEVLTALVNVKKIEDEAMVIRKKKILNAFYQVTLEDEYAEEVGKAIFSLIKGQYDNINIMELSTEYNIEILKKIVSVGMKPQNYLKELNSELSGYEVEGYLCDEDNILHQFNVVTKECSPIKEDKQTKKKRLF